MRKLSSFNGMRASKVNLGYRLFGSHVAHVAAQAPRASHTDIVAGIRSKFKINAKEKSRDNHCLVDKFWFVKNSMPEVDRCFVSCPF